MKRTGSNINGQNVDLNPADNDIQSNQLAAADHGNTGTAPSESGKVSVLNKRTLGVAAVLGLLFSSLLAGTLFFTSADDSASPDPNFAAKTVSEKTTFTFSKSQPAEFSTASSFNRSVLDPADISSSQKTNRTPSAASNQKSAYTFAAQPSSTDSARSQCAGAACASPRRAPVDADTGTKVRLFKLGVADSKLVSGCTVRNRVCTAKDGELVGGAKFALYEGTVVDEANKIGQDFTVGEGGVELPGLQPGKYTLKEVAPPAGYELNPNTVTFTVRANGTVYRRYSKFIYDFKNNEFYFPNLKAPEVWLFKLGVEDLAVCSWGFCSEANGELLDGAEFALYEGTEADEAHKVGKTFTVGTDGLKIPGLQVGKNYTLKEVAAPDSYDINPATYTFEVDADGKAKYQTDSGSQSFTDNKIYFPNQKKAAPPEVKLKLFKLGVADSKLVSGCTVRGTVCSAGDGELVAGARFALYKGSVSEANKVGEYTVGEDGVEISGLQQGSYTLKEVEAPAGYELNPNNVSLNVKSDGKVERRNGKRFISLENNEFYFPNLKAVEPEVWLFKLGVEKLADCSWGSCSTSTAGSELVGGARFALYEGTEADTEHQVGENFTVGTDGLKIPGLQVGKNYTLKEVAAPDSYDINPATYTFEVDADGKAKYQTDAGSQFFTDNKIYFPNQKAAPPAVKLRLFKLGVTDSKLVSGCTVRNRVCTAKDGELVGGAKFALYEGTVVDEANKIGQDFTVGEGGVELPGLQPGKYTLKEVAPPAGYELNPNTVTFTVRANGTVYRRYSKFIYDFKNNEFYFPNLKVQTIDISLNKVSDKDTPLENVKFDLYEADNPDKPLQNITTGNDGKANLTVTPGGKYRLVETQTYPGYALLPQPIEFQVEANGTVTIDKQNGNVNTVTGGDKTLKVVNYPEGKLPLSGQSGFLLVLLSGLSLLLAAVAISLVGRKRN